MTTIYIQVLGGQSFFRKVVEQHPENEHFYLTEEDREVPQMEDAIRATAIPLPSLPDYLFHRLNLVDLDFPLYFYSAMIEAYRVAHAVQGHTFDIIEVPDYLILGAFIKPALDHFMVKYKKVVLSMHGTTSTSMRYGWNPAALDITRQYVEELSYRVADLRYCISKAYGDEWSEYTSIAPCFVDPLQYLRFEINPSPADGLDKPSLNFVGRCEKRKGPDIFIDLASAVPRHLFSRAAIYGDVVPVSEQLNSTQYLTAMARSSGLPVRIFSPLSGTGMLELFASPSVLFVPSRYDLGG